MRIRQDTRQCLGWNRAIPVAEHAVHYLEIVTTDVTAARELYQQAFGWKFTPVPELGGASVAELPNGSRCGIRAPLRETEKPIVRT